MIYIEYPDGALEYLSVRDERLGALIRRIGPIRRERSADVFASLVHSLVDQQISTKAARVIWERLRDATGIDPAVISGMSEDALRSLGLSRQKALYIRGAAQAVISGELDIEALYGMSDDEVIISLCALYGVGVWTAEMLMIFALGRLNVLSERDAGIVRGIKRVYGVDSVTAEFIDELKARLDPYGTVASLYFWAAASE